MRVVDEARFAELIDEGAIAHRGCEHLDGIKIGLSLEAEGRVLPEVIDAQGVVDWRPVDLRSDPLVPGKLYLFSSAQSISLPPSIFGFMHTRSRFARLGLDFLGSSTYVAPSFGKGMPTKLVLEVTCKALTRNLPLDVPVAALVLFEADAAIRPQMAANVFPFSGVDD
jgi:deoxycytidine triphosphate deaminase